MKQRLTDLANRCYQNGHYTFSHFLSASEMDEFLQMKQELAFVPFSAFGGSEDAERQIVRFGSVEMFGYEEAFPAGRPCRSLRKLSVTGMFWGR